MKRSRENHRRLKGRFIVQTVKIIGLKKKKNQKNVEHDHTEIRFSQDCTLLCMTFYFLASFNFAKSSSASVSVLTRRSIGVGTGGVLGSIGGFGMQTSITLFFPTRWVVSCGFNRMLRRMLPRDVSARITSCVLSSLTFFKCKVPTPFSV